VKHHSLKKVCSEIEKRVREREEITYYNKYALLLAVAKRERERERD
jgi:hypothetical protein